MSATLGNKGDLAVSERRHCSPISPQTQSIPGRFLFSVAFVAALTGCYREERIHHFGEPHRTDLTKPFDPTLARLVFYRTWDQRTAQIAPLVFVRSHSFCRLYPDNFAIVDVAPGTAEIRTRAFPVHPSSATHNFGTWQLSAGRIHYIRVATDQNGLHTTYTITGYSTDRPWEIGDLRQTPCP